MSLEYSHYFRQLLPNKIITGDFNSHHRMWNTRRPNNSSGNNLVDALIHNPTITLLTPPSLPTHYDIRTGNFSTLDLCFISAHLYSLAHAKLGEDIGSDHYPVLITVSIKPSITKFKARSRWKFETGDWGTWKKHLGEPVDYAAINSVEVSSNAFAARLTNASLICFKSTKETVTPRYSKPWWTEKCATLVNKKKYAKNMLHRHPTMSNLIEFKRCAAMVKREVKASKRESWKDYCNNITSFTKTSVVWKKIGRLKNSYRLKTNPILTANAIITDPAAKANCIADHYETVLNNPPPTINPLFMLLPLSLAICDETELSYNKPFSLHELKTNLKHLKNTSPGQDKIHNKHLAHLPPRYEHWLLDIFNKSFANSTVPPLWKLAEIVPILKPSKPPTAVSSYRPISLLSCISKIMEKLICSRLYFHLETNSNFSKTQGGFRKRICTLDQIARLEQTIRHSLGNRENCIVVFFDLSNAFDKVWHTALLYKLCRSGVKGLLLKWIAAYLEDRCFRVSFEGELSTIRKISSGVPQGAILSPTLFNVMMSDLPRNTEVISSEYADDITIYCTGENILTITNFMQSAINNFYRWTKDWGLSLNQLKTKCMLFTKKHVQPIPLNIDNINIEYVREHKFLGVYFDAPGLRWKHHIHYIKDSSINKINLLKSISHHKWGADRQMLLKLYIALVRSRLDYGSIFYNTCCKSHIDKLNVIQNTCLRIATGARKTTPINSLEVESDIPPLNIHRQLLICKYYYRISQLSISLPIVKELFLSTDHVNRRWNNTTIVPPLRIRAETILMDLSIAPSPPIFADILSPIPPWVDITNIFKAIFIPNMNVAQMSSGQAHQMYLAMMDTTYLNYLPIFTDGSKVSEPEVSSAAMSVPSMNLIYGWKLPACYTVLHSEMFAIKQALNWIKSNPTISDKIVIFSDSLSSIYLLMDRSPTTHLYIAYYIQKLLFELSGIVDIKIQFIPGHKDIPGNESADQAATAAHSRNVIMNAAISREEKVRSVKLKLCKLWENAWINNVEVTGKGEHLMKVRSSVGFWQWSSNKCRVIETSIARLRLGHAGLNEHLHRFRMRDSALCGCGKVESVTHYLLQCPAHYSYRNLMKSKLLQLSVDLSLKNLLGGGEFPPEKQAKIVDVVADFLICTNKLWDI